MGGSVSSLVTLCMALLVGLRYGWQELPTAKDAQLWIHANLNVTSVIDAAFLCFFAAALVTNIHRFIQRP